MTEFDGKKTDISLLNDGQPNQEPSILFQAGESLSQILVSMLERRYLSNFQLKDWRIEKQEMDKALPLLSEVEVLGRCKQQDDWSKTMPYVLTATHDLGHSYIYILHGQGIRHHFYLGGRRIVGKSTHSTADYFKSQQSAFKAYFPGLKMKPIMPLNSQNFPGLGDLIQTAPAMCAITGIPSGRGGLAPLEIQSVDHLARAIGSKVYALMVVAEPIEPYEVDTVIDRLLQLRSEVHSYVRINKSQTRGNSTSKSSTETEAVSQWGANLPLLLNGLAIFCQALHIIPSFNALGALSTVLQNGSLFAMQQNRLSGIGNSQQLTTSETLSESKAVEIFNAHAEIGEQMLVQYIQRLQSARSYGWWKTAIYVVAEEEATLTSVVGAFRSICSGDATYLDPVRAVTLPNYLIRKAIQQGTILSLYPAQTELPNPLGDIFNSVATNLNSHELSVVVNMPRNELPGLPMREIAHFGLTAPVVNKDFVELGQIQSSTGDDLEAVKVPISTLNRHVFVSGMSGYGKTTTCKQILIEAYIKLGIPFLVIEPAKTEYRNLLRFEKIKEHIDIYTIGGRFSTPLRLNPFTLIPGVSLGRHIDLLKAVFNASFPMFAGMSYVLEEAILEVYEEKGWNLYSSQNEFLSAKSSFSDKCALTPSLQDLHDKIDVILERKKYGQEINQNLGAALRSRLRSLMVANKGIILNSRRSTPVEKLFEKPAVIELQNLGDDEEKAFVMALLFVFLYEYAESRNSLFDENGNRKLCHLTLIEEAHRLLQGQRQPTSGEVADPRAKAVSMFTEMLAEMRAYGEGFIIADQIPTKLTSETMKNTSLKIVHRLSAIDDRQVVGSCMNLSDTQVKFLNNLTTGLAVVHDEQLTEAVLIRINAGGHTELPVLTNEELIASVSSKCIDKIHLHKHAGCSYCFSPCDFYYKVDGIKKKEITSQTLTIFFENLYFNDMSKAWNQWNQWKEENKPKKTNTDDSTKLFHKGVLYCLATQAFHDWISLQVKVRNQKINAQNPLSPEDIIMIEHAAQVVSELFHIWLDENELSDKSSKHFHIVYERLIGIIASQPPRPLPGCEKCPSPCHILPFVVPSITTLTIPLEKILHNNQSASESLPVIERIAAQSLQNIPIISNQTDKIHHNWLYCLLTNLGLTPFQSIKRDEILELIQIKCSLPLSGS